MRYYLVFVLIFISTICNSQIINFPDPNFKARLLAANASNGNACIGTSIDNCVLGVIDANGNGEIEVSEAENVVMLFVNNTGTGINDLTGIEYFTNLEHFDCTNNNLTTINLSQNTSLKFLNCNNNNLSSLSLDGLIHLETIGCRSNQLASLEISEQTQLKLLLCEGNQINSIDFSNNYALQRVYCGNNLLTTLDFGANPQLFDLGCRNNPNLASINIKNGMTQVFGAGTLYNQCWNNLPNLNYICADDNEITALQSFLAGCGVTQSITIDSACPLSVNEYVLNNDIIITPNPSTSGIYTLLFDEPKTATVEVYTLLGQKLHNEQIIEQKEYKLFLDNVAKGSYLLKVSTGKETVTKTIIKQ